MSFHPKSITDLRGGVEKQQLRSPKINFREIFRVFDFRLLQQYQRQTGRRSMLVSTAACDPKQTSSNVLVFPRT
jgi:hypothetical protein